MWKKGFLRQSIKKTEEGQLEWITGLFFLLILGILLCGTLQLDVFRASAVYLEDALAASNLASAVIDVEEYGISHTILIEDPDRAYEIYLSALQGNLNLNEEWECPGKGLIGGQVRVLDYIVYNVHEDNVVNLEISYSNLISKTAKTFYPYGEKVCVDVLSPDGETAYHFEKLYDEIMQDTSIQEQIAVTPGEWTLKISFAYVCDEARSHFKVCASYESPSEEDINWLREARLREHDAGIQPETKGDTADFELTDDGKKFLEYICKTVNDFERTDEKDETFWRDFLFLAYTGLWEDEAEIVKVPRADLGFDEPVVKVRLEEAQAYARLVFGEELPDLKPAFEEMKERQTSFFFADGCYYIGTSDFPDFQFHFDDCTVYEEEGSVYAVAQYGIDFEGASNVGTVRLTLVPAENENGFVLIEKERAFVSGF